LLRHQAHPGGELAAILEFVRIAHYRHGGERDDRADAQYFHQPGGRFAVACELALLAVILPDPLAKYV
jgi:hypothetical protein